MIYIIHKNDKNLNYNISIYAKNSKISLISSHKILNNNILTIQLNIASINKIIK